MYAYFTLDFIISVEVRSIDEIKNIKKNIKKFLIEKIFCLICEKKKKIPDSKAEMKYSSSCMTLSIQHKRKCW